jgi:hypothetical protein
MFTLLHCNASLPNHARGVTNDLLLRCFSVANHSPFLPILWEWYFVGITGSIALKKEWYIDTSFASAPFFSFLQKKTIKFSCMVDLLSSSSIAGK